jgi:hypothetical protein
MSEMNDFIADPRRVLLGAIAAPLIASLVAEIPTFGFESFWGLFLLGFLSVVTLYLPLVLWRLRRTRRPLLTCVVVGGLSAPGLLGYSVSIVGSLVMADPRVIMFPLIATFPLGAIGGAIFWLSAVWRSEGFTQQDARLPT